MAALATSTTVEVETGSRAGKPRLTLVHGLPVRVPAPGRSVGKGRLRPPTRRRPVGAPHVVAAPDCGPRRAPMSLLVVLGLAALVAALVYGVGALANSVVVQSEVPSTTTVVRVAAGESLSDVAAKMAPDSDTTAVVERIRELNGLDDATVRPGQPLTVPVSR
ncbi:LysM peptidoglycan-binding domain-containing protein [Actinokineospora terrae]|uniref:LysM domain-containing protein n=1 Tax=Actinokineospora terrae TaxID=155974 RepID=A0A1H9XSE2_9PSEU|nr:LysM peptidoglycan-binding domain-containing protein [Actinokineospora terrae]SES48613.1 LysM domain-containing protein [Actinokineospora terrae]